MPAYYNEIDPFAAAWLRELIKAGLIAPGDVDERDIQDVTPTDLAAYDQWHFFAGIGTWSYALRQAGWPDNRPVCTGSCPCQPFSTAGKRGGFDDERHLWPAWFWLIRQSRPRVIFGEQVSSKDGLAWLDLVQTDLEAAGYAVGPLDLCAAGVGAPHKRQRLFFVADANEGRRGTQGRWAGIRGKVSRGRPNEPLSFKEPSASGGRHLGNTEISRDGAYRGQPQPGGRQQEQNRGPGILGSMAHTQGQPIYGIGRGSQEQGRETEQERCQSRSCRPACCVAHTQCDGGRADEPGRRQEGRALDGRPGPVNGFWRGAHWVWCNDPDGAKWRAIEPGTFPLANGTPARLGRLRGYGNGIVAPLAVEFIRAYMEIADSGL